MSKIERVEGRVILTDGSVSEFSICRDYGWQQWGATTERLAETGEAVDAMTQALAAGYLATEFDTDDDEPTEDATPAEDDYTADDWERWDAYWTGADDDQPAAEPEPEPERCPACLKHPGWAHGDLTRRRQPADLCPQCHGSGVRQAPAENGEK